MNKIDKLESCDNPQFLVMFKYVPDNFFYSNFFGAKDHDHLESFISSVGMDFLTHRGCKIYKVEKEIMVDGMSVKFKEAGREYKRV